MTRDDIIKMAREAGASFETADSMFKFAALVAAAEREKMVSQQGWRQCAMGQRSTQFCGMAEVARKEERETCVKVCEEHWRHGGTAQECADAIRARGNQ